ncbi:MAG: tyrosine-type recombinase/integrase [Saprospiraceae bacterium]
MRPKELFDIKTGERKYLNEEERKAFLDATAYEERDIKFFSRFLYYTGARTNEALSITPMSLDFNDKGVIIRTLKQGKDKDGKEKNRYRFIELPDAFLENFSDNYQLKKNQSIQKNKDLKIWNFTDRTGHNYVKKVMAKAEITGKKACPRGLRHALGVALVLNRVPLPRVKEWLGHADIKNTEIYTYVMGNERREMMARIW